MDKGGLIFLGCLGAAAILLPFVLRRREAASYQLVPVRRQLQNIPAEGLLHYKNKETRSIEWNEDSLPTKVIIEREYYQLP